MNNCKLLKADSEEYITHLFDVRVTNRGPEVRHLAEKLWQEICEIIPKYKISRRKETLINLIMNLLEGSRKGKRVAYSRDRNNYTMHKRYGMLHFKYDLLVPMIDELVRLGYIDNTAGIYNRTYPKNNRYPTMMPTVKLRDLLDDLIYVAPTKRMYTDPILLKKEKILVDYPDTEYTRTGRTRLYEYNDLVSSSKTSITKIFSYKNPLNIEIDCRIYRVYNDEFDFGGRAYGAQHQAYNAGDRATILDDGEKTREVDYSSMHARMLYNMVGMDFKADPYLSMDNKAENRELFKKTMNVMYNSKKRHKAIWTIKKEISHSETLSHDLRISGYKVKDLVEMTERAHPEIAKYFFTGIGIELQRKDSDIISDVMDHFTKKGIKTYPVHDSLVIKEIYEDELIDTMKGMYFKHMGYEGQVK